MERTGLMPFVARVIGAIRLNRGIYRTIDGDQRGTVQAVAVVALVGAANGIGVAFTDPIGYLGFFVAAAGNFLAWFLIAGAAYAIGVSVLPGDATEAESDAAGTLRTLGFAQAPNMLGIAAVVGLAGEFISLLGLLWSLVCGIVAIEVSLRVSTLRAIAIGLIAGFVTVIVVGFLLNVVENLVA